MPDSTETPGRSPDTQLRAEGIAALQARAWTKAADTLSRLTAPDLAVRLQITVARNMDALQQHRPAIYQTLLESPQRHPARAVSLPDGQLTIVQRNAEGRELILSLNKDPAASLATHQKELAPVIDGRLSLGLCGIGDGYLLVWLAAHHREGIVGEHGMQRVIWIIEPDPEVVMAALMLHDMTGPDGAIEQRRFIWFVGPNWSQQMTHTMRTDTMLPLPGAAVGQGLRAREALDSIEAARKQFEREETRIAAQLEQHYANVTAEELAELLGDHPPRRPRVLVMTSRFTMVLRHSAEDMAAALRHLGCEVRLLVEPDDCRRAWSYTLRRALCDFKPDMAMTIDHLRRESGTMFPRQLPFVCWIQDYFPYLTEKSAGRSVTLRDFVLAAGITECVEKFAYPQRQCIEMGKLTHVPARPTTWKSDGDDLVFVSNASALPTTLAEEFVASARDRDAVEARVARASCDELLAHYERGQHVNTLLDVEALIDRNAEACGFAWRDSDARDRFAFALFHPVNDALYRQQALRWAKASAEKRGLTLSIYGKGWDQHPDFAHHARGPVCYGGELEELTRRSKINLQIVPHSCLHQRLLDGLVAGGFFLARSNPIDHYTHDLLVWFEQCLPDEAQSSADVLTLSQGDARSRFKALMARRATLMVGTGVDPVARYRQRQNSGATHLYQLPPRMAEVSFENADQFDAMIDHFIHDEAARRAIAEAQRAFVESHYTYEAGMAYVMKQVHGRLSDEAAHVVADIRERVA